MYHYFVLYIIIVYYSVLNKLNQIFIDVYSNVNEGQQMRYRFII